METKEEMFKKELATLLEKYKAGIFVELDGDTHGVSTSIVLDIEDKEVFRLDYDNYLTHWELNKK